MSGNQAVIVGFNFATKQIGIVGFNITEVGL